QDQLPRQRVRQLQMVTALEYALILKPDDSEAHRMLFELYSQARYLDMALDHLKEVVKSVNASGPGPNETREQFHQRMDNLQKVLKNMDTQVTRLRNEYELSAANQPLLNKAQMALNKGLGKRALELLLDADPAQIDIKELNLLLELLLSTGQPEKVREGLTEN